MRGYAGGHLAYPMNDRRCRVWCPTYRRHDQSPTPECLNGGRQRHEISLVANLRQQAARLQCVTQILFYACHCEQDPTTLQISTEPVERIERGHVDLHIRLGIEDEPFDGLRVVIDSLQRTAAEILRVSEAQRRVVAVYHQTGHQFSLRIVIDVMHARHPWHEAEHAVVATRYSSK